MQELQVRHVTHQVQRPSPEFSPLPEPLSGHAYEAGPDPSCQGGSTPGTPETPMLTLQGMIAGIMRDLSLTPQVCMMHACMLCMYTYACMYVLYVYVLYKYIYV